MATLDLADAMGFAEELTLLRFLPAGDTQLVKIAEIIREICRSKREAAALVKKILATHNEWPGPQALREIQRDLTGREPEIQKYQEFSGYEKPTDLCEKCQSWGVIAHLGAHFRCDCESGAVITDRWLAILDAMKSVKPASAEGEEEKMERISECLKSPYYMGDGKRGA